MVDSDLTPYVLVDAEGTGVSVPRDYVSDGQIVLNLGPNAVRQLHIGDDALRCDSRFGGRPYSIHVPIASIRAIYARESGDGMMFDPEAFPGMESTGSDPDPDKPGPGGGSGHLKVVK